MATLACLVFVPCKVGPTAVAVNQPNSATVYRTPVPQPLNLTNTSGSSAPTGPQRWPL